MADSIALLVAIDRYDDPGLRQLQAPQYDLAALARVLGNPMIGGYQVQTLHNQPMQVVQEHIGDLFAGRSPDDRLLLYFSGHGLKSDSGELYLATTSTKVRNCTATAVPSWFVRGEIERSLSKRIILLLDCCYGGAFSRGLGSKAGDQVDVLDQFQGRGRAVITASTAMQYAFELDRDHRSGQPSPSVFTSALVRGLETGEADGDQDGRISVNELYKYLFDEVRRQVPGQTPTGSINVEGELYIARSTRRQSAPPGPLPAPVYEAIGSPLPSVREGVIADLKTLLTSTNPDLSRAARQSLERLAEDDSRRVSSAAATALGPATPTPTPTEHRVAPEPPRQPSELFPSASPGDAAPLRQPAPRQPALVSDFYAAWLAERERDPARGGDGEDWSVLAGRRSPAPQSPPVRPPSQATSWSPATNSSSSPSSPSAISGNESSVERRREWLDGRPRRRSRTANIAPILAIAGLLFGVGGLGWAIVAFKPFQGMGWSVASLPVIGLLAGVVTTAIFPRRDPGGIIVTMIIGIVGALLGGFVVWAVSGAEAFTGFFGLRTWLTGVAGSTFLLLLYRAVVNPGRRRVI